MGIQDDFQQQSIVSCIAELKLAEDLQEKELNNTISQLNSGPVFNSTSQVKDQLAIVTERLTERLEKGNIFTANNHHFIQITFNNLTNCDFCQSFLRGFFHQGLMCQSKSYFHYKSLILCCLYQ